MALPNIIQQINSKLPLSGGTMTGIISSSNDTFLRGTSNNKRRHICSGTTYDKGAYICLDGCEVDDTQSNYYKGQFFIGAHNSTNQTILVGRPDGTLTWGGNNVITSAGGNMSGSIIHQATTVIQRKDDTGALWIHGGVAWGDGASLELCGKSRTTNTGGFMIQTNDGTTRKNLTGGPNTDLNWDGKLVVCVTKWKSGTQWYRKYSDGWIEQGGQTPRTSDAYISISFPIAFTQDNPNVQLTRRFYYDNDTSSPQNRTTGVSSVTKTGFKCYDNGWSANGYGTAGVWYACGF